MGVDPREASMKNLKIVFVIDSLGTGGAEQELAQRLSQFGHEEVTSIVVSLRPRDEGVQADLHRRGFDVRILNVSGLLAQVMALRKIIRTERPAVVETVLFNSDIAGRLAAIGTSVKVISRLVNTDYDEGRLHDPHIRVMKFRLA